MLPPIPPSAPVKLKIKPYPNTVVLVGDSISRQQSTTTSGPLVAGDSAWNANGAFIYANKLLYHRFSLFGNCGGSGQNSTQLLARMGTGVAQVNGFGQSAGPSIVSGGTGYAAGDQITLQNGAVIQVYSVSGGVVTGLGDHTQGQVGINAVLSSPTFPMGSLPSQTQTQASTTGGGTGFSCTCQYPGDPLWFATQGNGVGIYILEIGTNDIGQNGSGTTSVATTWSNIKAIVQLLLSTGSAVVLATIPPNSSVAAATSAPGGLQRQQRLQINQYIREYCTQYPGLYLWDFAAAVTDPATGTYVGYGASALTPAASQDGVHPNYYGGSLAGRALYDTLNLIQTQMPLVDTGAAEASDLNYAINGYMAGSNASGTNDTYITYTGVTLTGNGPNNCTALMRNNSSSLTGACSVVTTRTAGQLWRPNDRIARINFTAGSPASGMDGVGWRFGGDDTNAVGRWDVAWVSNTAVVIGEKRRPKGTIANGAYAGMHAVCVVAGTTGATEPTWPTQPYETYVDNGVTWQMIPSPNAVPWVANIYYGVGAIVQSGGSNSYYLKCTTAGLSGGTIPTWNSSINGTTTDNTVTWTTISIPSYQFYAEIEYQLSGFSAGQQLGVVLNLVHYDTSTATTTTTDSYIDISGSGYGFALPTYAEAGGRLRTPPLTIPSNVLTRYLKLEAWCYARAAASGNFDVMRASIRPVPGSFLSSIY